MEKPFHDAGLTLRSQLHHSRNANTKFVIRKTLKIGKHNSPTTTNSPQLFFVPDIGQSNPASQNLLLYGPVLLGQIWMRNPASTHCRVRNI